MDEASRRGPVYKRLMLASFGVKSVGADDTQGMGASLPQGGRTSSLADAAAGGPRIRSGMEKAGAAKAPASALELVSNNAREPSPANGRPVLKLLQGGSNRPSRKSNVRLRLVLTT